MPNYTKENIMRKLALLASLTIFTAITPTKVAAQPVIPAPCQKYVQLALDVGFKKGELEELFRLAYRESRCNPKSIGYNKRANGTVWSTDIGIMQVNDYSWITYLRGKKIVSKSSELTNPRKNLRAALALKEYSEKEGYGKWHQWRTARPNGSAGNVTRK
jgi:hypothetical protein